MTTPLRERRLDWFFIVAFATFAATSLVVDTVVLLGPAGLREAMMAGYADCDPLMKVMPPFLRTAVGASAFVWGPLYLYFVWAFVRGHNRVRPLALFYSGALTLAMAMILSEELWSHVPGWASPNAAKFLALNAPYAVVPMMLGWRMRSPFPFGGTEPG